MRVRFVDGDKRPVNKDGLLLVLRDHSVQLGYILKTKETAHLVEITDGIARMPDESVIAMLGLWWLPPFPPWVGVYPGKNVRIEPYLPGYFCDRRIVEFDQFKSGELIMEQSDGREGRAISDWSVKLTGLTNKPTQPPLNDDDHRKLKAYIEAELQRLRESPNERRIEAVVIDAATQYLHEKYPTFEYERVEARRFRADDWLVAFINPPGTWRDRKVFEVTDEGVVLRCSWGCLSG
jgi:hypothetical protein